MLENVYSSDRSVDRAAIFLCLLAAESQSIYRGERRVRVKEEFSFSKASEHLIKVIYYCVEGISQPPKTCVGWVMFLALIHVVASMD